MERVLYVVSRVFGSIFSTLGASTSPVVRILYIITTSPFLHLGVVFVIVGFVIGIIQRMIHS